MGAFESMAKALTSALSQQTDMANKMLERSYRREVSSVAAEMGRKGREVRQKKEADAAAAAAAQVVMLDMKKVKECEECAAELENRAPRHTDHLFRHSQERHAQLVLPLCHANGAAN